MKASELLGMLMADIYKNGDFYICVLDSDNIRHCTAWDIQASKIEENCNKLNDKDFALLLHSVVF